MPATISSFFKQHDQSPESTNKPLTKIGSVRQTPDVDMLITPVIPFTPLKKKLKTRSQARVHFAVVDGSNELLCTVYGDRVELTEEEIELMWWKAEEAAHFRKRAKHVSKVYQSAGTTCPYTVNFKRAIELCSTTAGSMENIPLVSNTPARGLEPYVFPELTSKRRKVVRTIVNAQRKLPDGLHPEQKAKLLNAASKSLTRSARRMSRILAIGDASVAAKISFNFDEL